MVVLETESFIKNR